MSMTWQSTARSGQVCCKHHCRRLDGTQNLRRGENCKIMATICCVVASNRLTEAALNEYQTFWMKPKFLAIVYANDSSASTVYWLPAKSSFFSGFDGDAGTFRG